MKDNTKKKSYKEIHGVTRVGSFLSKIKGVVLPTVLDAVGLGDIAGALGIINKSHSNAGLTNEEVDEFIRLYELDLKDLAGARDMYKSTDHEVADFVAKRVINYNLWVVLVSIVLEVTSVIYIEDKVLIAIISGAVGSFATSLLQERQQVIGFFFGASRVSNQENNNK